MGRAEELLRLEHQLELANRAVRLVMDDPTKQRLREFAQDVEGRIATLNEIEVEAAIRSRAHRLWREAGCPEGRDVEFWTEAERYVRNMGSAKLWDREAQSASVGRL